MTSGHPLAIQMMGVTQLPNFLPSPLPKDSACGKRQAQACKGAAQVPYLQLNWCLTPPKAAALPVS